jgi:hypothetical protein
MLAAFGNPRIFKERKRLATILDKTEQAAANVLLKSRVLQQNKVAGKIGLIC